MVINTPYKKNSVLSTVQANPNHQASINKIPILQPTVLSLAVKNLSNATHINL